jgi:hypothetical protein
MKVAVPVLNPDAAGIDIGATEIYVAVPADRDPEPVRIFATFTQDLHEFADWLQQCHVRTVAMESTGVYWIPLMQILEIRGPEVYLVNAEHVKNVPGRRTVVSDYQWLQYLHSVGLLRASFRPAQDLRNPVVAATSGQPRRYGELPRPTVAPAICDILLSQHKKRFTAQETLARVCRLEQRGDHYDANDNIDHDRRGSLLRRMRDGQGMGSLQHVLHAKCDIFGAGRATAGRENARAVHGLDEGHDDGTAGCLLRGEVIRDGQRAEQRCRLRRISWHPQGTGRASSSDGPPNQHGLRVRDAIRGRQDRPLDQNMERRPGAEGTRLGIARFQAFSNLSSKKYAVLTRPLILENRRLRRSRRHLVIGIFFRGRRLDPPDCNPAPTSYARKCFDPARRNPAASGLFEC